MTTFSELGIPFPLFEAPTDEAPTYVEAGRCVACGDERPHTFRLGLGQVLIRACPACGTDNPLDADDRQDAPCRECGEIVPFIEDAGDELRVCYGCLRGGRAAYTKDTTAGMVRFVDAMNGLTHGAPTPVHGIPRVEGFPTVPGDEDWVRVRVPSPDLIELVRTPSFTSWQGDVWLFHCQKPMVYIGNWDRARFEAEAGKVTFLERVLDATPDAWIALGTTVATHVFRCRACETMRGYWESA